MTEPGEVENRLSLNPSQFPEIAEWGDGQEYDITIGGTTTKIRQMTPGEFEVVPPVETVPEEVVEAPAPRSRSANPAVSSMIDSEYA